MCAGNPDKERAKIDQQKKEFAESSKANQFRNREAGWQIGQNRNVIGLSRDKSDIYARSRDIIGKGRQLQQQSFKEYAMLKGGAAAEGGRSTRAGRNDYLALLAKTSQIESKIGNTLGREYASATQGINRQYMAKVAANRSKLGLRPEFGPAVMYQPQSPWQKLQPVIGAVSTVASLGTSFGGPTFWSG